MNRQLRRLGLIMVVLYAVLFVQLNVLQVANAGKYKTNPLNTAQVIRDFTRNRGRILSADGQVIAQSVAADDRYKYQRQYPLGDLFAHPVGYFSLTYGADGVEKAQNDALSGQTNAQRLKGLGSLFRDKATTGDVTTTLRTDLQQLAKDALGEREGSVVVLDPRTGAVLAMWSWPSYDPNVLSSHDLKAVDAARKALLADDEAKPLLSNAFQERYMPGSTFKVITSTAALENGTTVDRVFDTERSYVPPLTTNPINNYGGSLCGGTFLDVFRQSCNTPFARLGVELGADKMVAKTKAFGFGEKVPIDLPGAAASFFGDVKDFAQNDPKLAQSSFGQNEVAVTPLHMALLAASVANKGRMMTPYVVAETHDADGTTLFRHAPSVWKTPMSEDTAATLTQAMTLVAQAGTARCCLKLEDGIQAAAKTGTAQLRAPDDPRGPLSHAWITTFAPAEAPRVAVAVMLKATPEVTVGTGGTLAGPIARQLLDAALKVVP